MLYRKYYPHQQQDNRGQSSQVSISLLIRFIFSQENLRHGSIFTQSVSRIMRPHTDLIADEMLVPNACQLMGYTMAEGHGERGQVGM
jgi:hypothetical protein